MQNLTVEQIQAVVLANRGAFVDNLESDQTYIDSIKSHTHPDYVERIRDNLFLERYGYIVYLESDDEASMFTMNDIKKVYEAAKAVFAKHPLANFCFDFDAYNSELGSPWGCYCTTPEMYAICYGRRLLEDDECAINSSDASTVQDVLDFLQEMNSIVGIPEEVLRENIAYICYDNEELTAKVKEIIG